MFKKTTLNNGLRFLSAPAKETNSLTLALYVKAGSRFERTKENGLAHFLEHLAFKGSPSYPTQFDVAKTVEGVGGVWNAGTNEELIMYFIKAEKSNLGLINNVLSEMVTSPLLKTEDIEGEKGVICEEINMYEDDPKDKVALLSQQISFKGNELSRSVAGTKELVRGFSRDDFLDYRSRFFVPENMVLCLSGSFNQEDEERVKDIWSGITSESISIPNYNKYQNDQKEPQSIFENRKTEQTHFVLSFKAYGRENPKKFSASLLGVILGGGIGSRLFQEVRTKRGLAYYVGAGASSFMDTGELAIRAGVTNNKFNEAVTACLDEVKKTKLDIKEEELERAKRQIIGHLAISLEDNAELNEFFAIQELLSGKILTYKEYVDIVNKVRVEDITSVANEIFTSQNLNLAVVGPQEKIPLDL